MQTIIEPFRIKSVEPIRFTTEAERNKLIQEAHYNLFLLKSEDVIIDLLTDSGTSAMSSEQWAAVMRGDESYAGSPSFYRFEAAVQKITAMKYIIPTHQGRASEKILMGLLGGKDKFVISNTLFDTTRANVEQSGATGLDFVCAEARDPFAMFPFKGNMDNVKLEAFIQQEGSEKIPLVITTITNNSAGGQPVSIANIRETSAICRKYGIPYFIDACRFAENSYFIKQREPGYADKSVLEIAQELFSYADGCTMSAKKDAFANMGGFIALNDTDLAEQCKNQLIVTEGFPTYGGLSGRDLEAIAVGLEEIVQEDYLKYRIRSIEYMGEKLETAGVPFIKPTGGHALFLDAGTFLPHIPAQQYPGQALAVALYETAGIRSVEIGSLMFGKYDTAGNLIPAMWEYVRLAIPRRVYTQSQFDYVAEGIVEVYKKRNEIKGLKITREAEVLRHFTAHLDRV